MDQVINVKNELESENIEILKYNENGPSHEKVDKQAVIDRMTVQTNAVSVAESLKDYTWEEKFEWIHQKRLKGNRLFNKKKFDDAFKMYFEALMGLDFNCSPEKKKRLMNELQIPTTLNMAACMKQKKEYRKAIELCNKAIEVNKENPVAYARRGMIYQAMKDYDQALADFRTAKNLGAEETLVASMQGAIDEINAAVEKHKKAYKGFFEKGTLYQETNGETTEVKEDAGQDSKSSIEEQESKILRYNDDLEELNHFGIFKYVAYPIKMSYKFVKDRTTVCCRRKRSSYVDHDNNQNYF